MSDSSTLTEATSEIEPAIAGAMIVAEGVFLEGGLNLAALEEKDADGQPVPLTHAVLEALSDRLNRLGRNVNWWLGDLLNYVNKHYGTQFLQYVDTRGYSQGHLATIMKTAEVFPDGSRYIPTAENDGEGFSWSHHAALSEISDGRRRTALARRCLKNGWTTADLREQIRAAESTEVTGTKVPKDPKDPVVASISLNFKFAPSDGQKAVDVLKPALDDVYARLIAQDLVVRDHGIRCHGIPGTDDDPDVDDPGGEGE
jgi:hypothetical protein